MSNIRNYLPWAASVLLLAACSSNSSPKKQVTVSGHFTSACDKPAALVNTINNGIFMDKSLTKPSISKANYGILLNLSAPYQILLTDGSLVWTPQVSQCQQTQITAAAPTLDATSLPLSQEGEEGFYWAEQPISSLTSVIGFSVESTNITPPHVNAQGRAINSTYTQHNFKWPQIQLSTENKKMWASLINIEFMASPKISPNGLIQRPFLALIDSNLIPSSPLAGQFYTDYTDQIPQKLPLPNNSWQLEQAVFTSSSQSQNVRFIGLYSSAKNCSIIQVAYHQQPLIQFFGYCKHGVSGPTPIIVDYKNEDPNKVTLTLLEINGDEQQNIRFTINAESSDIELIK
jgi:hypothetical protein